MTKWLSRPSLFLMSFLFFHLLIFVARDTERVFWHMVTGIFLLTTFSSLEYKRNLTSRRIGQSISTGLLSAAALIAVYIIAEHFIPAVRYPAVMKTLIDIGVHYRWQLMVSLALTVPLHELYFRTMLQETISNPALAVVVTSLASVSLFIWTLSPLQLLTLFLFQLVLATGYQYSRRLITPITGQILSVVILILLYT
ncbi:CPBP family glutamic-type intramembrane protease [Macrococcus carouselicus]|uniref:CAAX prenyl protease 2/Lysostaphin resistance protein A-like domain-containing protein n=1 Tax=Macrococcus carouselicus TaxID=69969 RepID=A0A9Q8CMM4_9STAP|nr:CPBP family glutamic-type intramembrane protease [Macrococcus carouselicus]TDM03819.1 hypothetical protein ERX40_01255 [Macrococcus carouselicus]